MTQPHDGSQFELAMHIPLALSKQLDSQAIAMRPQLQPEAEEDLNATSRFYFQPTMLLGEIHIDGRLHPVHRVKAIYNLNGQETARYFARQKGERDWIGFVGEKFDTFLDLCRQLHEVPSVNEMISFTALVEAAFEWFHCMDGNLKISQTDADGFTAATLSVCESEIVFFDIWIPVEGMEFLDSFRLGRVEFKNVSSQDLDNWQRQWSARWTNRKHPHLPIVNSFFTHINADLTKSFPVAVLHACAEPVRAVERALDEIEHTLGILRFFSPVNFYPLGVSYCTIEGKLPKTNPRHFLLREGELTSAGFASHSRADRPKEFFNTHELAEMRKDGLSVLHQLLQLEFNQRTPFERQLLKALSIYAKSNLTDDVSDKLIHIVVALESIFIQGKERSLRKRVAERLAFLLGKSLQERRAIIDMYSAAYDARSNVVHRGDEPQDKELLKSFLNLAWQAFHHLIENSKQYQTQTELLKKLDEIKFT